MAATYPDVPLADGVPPVNRTSVPSNVQPLTGDTVGQSGKQQTRWGVFTAAGVPIALADSVLSVEYSREFRISNYPVEQGGFASYDKVATPFEPRVVLAKGGTDDDRATFLKALDAACGSTDLYDVVTPDTIYHNANLIRVDFKRTRESGVGLLTVDLHLMEVRLSAGTTFSNSKAPSGVDATSNGSTQPVAPTAAQTPR